MEKLLYTFQATKTISRRSHVGVVASGDLEILISPGSNNFSKVQIFTKNDGFTQTWHNILKRFFEQYPISANIIIHDCGASPSIIYLRLIQGIKEIINEE